MKNFRLTFLFLCALLMAIPFASGGNAPPSPGKEIFPFVWAGLKDNRERLRRGAFRVKGRKIDDDPRGRRLDSDMTIFCAFDYDKDLFRFDRAEPEFFTKEPLVDRGQGPKALEEQGRKMRSDPKDWVERNVGGKWAKSETQCISWSIQGNSVSILRPHEEPDSSLRIFDVRTLGLLIWGNLVDRGTSWKDTCELYPELPLEAVQERKGLYRFRWVENASIPLRKTLWVDEAQGFSPVRLHTQEGQTSKDGIKWSEPDITSEVESVCIGGVWVPHTFRIETRESAPWFRSYQWTFAWESVNEPVAESLFTVEGMDLPKGTPVIDYRLGEPILKGRIGEEPSSTAGQTPLPGFLRRYGLWLVVLGGVAVACILVYWRVRSPKPTS